MGADTCTHRIDDSRISIKSDNRCSLTPADRNDEQLELKTHSRTHAATIRLLQLKSFASTISVQFV